MINKTNEYRAALTAFLLLPSFGAFAAEADPLAGGILQAEGLALYCYTVPNNANKLCYVQTESPYGPWDQVVYYRKDAAGALLLLGADKGSGVATFGGVSFSADGQYLWTDWAEEGHSSLYFYQTKAFLEVGLQQSVGAVHDYELDHVDGTLADGTLIYGLRKKTPNCADTTKYTVVTDQDACHQVVGLGVVVE